MKSKPVRGDRVRHNAKGWEPPIWRDAEEPAIPVHLDPEQWQAVERWNEKSDDEVSA